MIHTEMLKAVVNRLQNIGTRQPAGKIAHREIDLSGDDDLIAAREVTQGVVDDLLAAAVRIAVGGVKKIDPSFQRLLDQRAAALFRQCLGMAAAIGLTIDHATETKAGDSQVGIG